MHTDTTTLLDPNCKKNRWLGGWTDGQIEYHVLPWVPGHMKYGSTHFDLSWFIYTGLFLSTFSSFVVQQTPVDSFSSLLPSCFLNHLRISCNHNKYFSMNLLAAKILPFITTIQLSISGNLIFIQYCYSVDNPHSDFPRCGNNVLRSFFPLIKGHKFDHHVSLVSFNLKLAPKPFFPPMTLTFLKSPGCLACSSADCPSDWICVTRFRPTCLEY